VSVPEETGPAGAYESGESPFLRKAKKPALQRTFPVTEHLPKYRRRRFVRDLTAGLTVGALAIPSSMASAELIGVPPVFGLYVLLLPLIAYAALGSSRQVIIGPEAGVAAMLGAALVGLGGGDPTTLAALASITALLVGGCFVVARLLRLGWIADYFSRAVLIGYLHGICVVLIVGQLGKLTGVPSGEDKTIPQLAHAITHLGDIHGASFVVGLVALVSVLLLGRFVPKWPGALIVVVGAIIVSAAVDLAAHGVAVVGDIPPGLPRITIPSVSGADIGHLLPVALGVFFVSFADSILTARSFAGRHNQNVDANQELLALGVANLAAGVSQGFSPSASGSRTAVNDQMGARTQMAGLISVALVVAVLLFLTAPMEYLPSPVLAALIVAAAIGIVDPAGWRSLAASGRAPVVIAAVTSVGVIVLGILPALGLAVVMSIVEIVARGAHPHDAVLGFVPRLGRYGDVRFHRRAVVAPGVVVYRVDDRVFFANVGYVVGRINEAIAGAPTDTRVVVFDAERVPGVDATAVEALQRLIGVLRDRGIEVMIARAGRSVIDQFERTGILALLGEGHLHPTVSAAVAASV
jgi:SulP family sulfate permease